MAAVAFFRRSFEYACNVTVFTWCCKVYAGQREAGGRVIEIASGRRCFRHRLQCEYG
jgi:hypothetical protein